MPEYLTPGVYLEETSFRSKSIEGVPTSTFGMAGVTLYGPVPCVFTTAAGRRRPGAQADPGHQLHRVRACLRRAGGGRHLNGLPLYLAHARGCSSTTAVGGSMSRGCSPS